MSRLTASLRLDARLQARNRVYTIVLVAASMLGLTLRGLFTPDQLHFFMPLVALSGVGITTFILVGVLILLERQEGTLDVVLVSPLRPGEYLASKILTLTALAALECGLIAGIAYGVDFTVLWLALAVMLRASFVAAIGVTVAVRYRSLTRFLLPIAVLSIAFDLPVLWYLGLWPGPFLHVWPTLPSLLLAKAAFMPVAPLEIAYALVYGVLAVMAALFLASRALLRFVVRGDRAA